MTVGELIEKLKEFDSNLTVVYATREELEEPFPRLETYNFKTSYYDGKEFQPILKNEAFVLL